MGTTILTNVRIVLPVKLGIGVMTSCKGSIAEVSLQSTSVPTELVVRRSWDVWLTEFHTVNPEHHLQPRPKEDWLQFAAIVVLDAELALAGITTVFDALPVGSTSSGKKSNHGVCASSLSVPVVALRWQGTLRIIRYICLRTATLFAKPGRGAEVIGAAGLCVGVGFCIIFV
ncbi:hypothetical protein BFP70_06175 [Thioclava sp. SK-1]|uniref:hypothetical protein n=1 Tax=Thioclava sp. SK-1 TaxID=1889770 RepID=UPI0008241CF2|nr:hypothetical protein [Thioclava sp. SK-1]OCX66286.1 hypothetical protein BFP70_06175 [Thioclava sp. SK-1]